jgi:hypothetical protein
MAPRQTTKTSIDMLASVVVKVPNGLGLFPIFHEQISHLKQIYEFHISSKFHGRQLTTHGFKSLLVPVFHEQISYITTDLTYHERRLTDGRKKHQNSRIQIASRVDDGATIRQTQVSAFGRRDETI